VCAAGLYTCLAEAGPYLNDHFSNNARQQTLASGQLRPGFSPSSAFMVLNECLWALGSITASLEPADTRAAIVDSCSNLAVSISEARPAMSLAWYVRALVDDARDDVAALRSDLLKSQATDAAGQWIAQLRVPLAEKHLADLDAKGLAAHEADLGLLVQSRSGIAAIAGRYVADAAFRSRITALVSKLPPGDQQRFIDNVRSAADDAATQ